MRQMIVPSLVALSLFAICSAFAAPANSPADEAKIAATVRDLGFQIGQVKPLGPGRWSVQVHDFDPTRAAGPMRGVITAPEARSASSVMTQGRTTAGSSKGVDGRRGPGAPAGGPRTGTAAAGGDDPLAGGGATASSSNSPSKPEKSGGGGPRSGWLNLSVAPDGAISLDAASLRSLNLSATVNQKGTLSIR